MNNSSQRNTLSPDEWDFKGIPQSELWICWNYEFAREALRMELRLLRPTTEWRARAPESFAERLDYLRQHPLISVGGWLGLLSADGQRSHIFSLNLPSAGWKAALARRSTGSCTSSQYSSPAFRLASQAMDSSSSIGTRLLSRSPHLRRSSSATQPGSIFELIDQANVGHAKLMEAETVQLGTVCCGPFEWTKGPEKLRRIIELTKQWQSNSMSLTYDTLH
jgi:hypothetical protein